MICSWGGMALRVSKLPVANVVQLSCGTETTDLAAPSMRLIQPETYLTELCSWMFSTTAPRLC